LCYTSVPVVAGKREIYLTYHLIKRFMADGREAFKYQATVWKDTTPTNWKCVLKPYMHMSILKPYICIYVSKAISLLFYQNHLLNINILFSIFLHKLNLWFLLLASVQLHVDNFYMPLPSTKYSYYNFYGIIVW